jgi:hypothetical protein
VTRRSCVLELQSLLRFGELLSGDPVPFALTYSAGNILSIAGCAPSERSLSSAPASTLNLAVPLPAVATGAGRRSSSVRDSSTALGGPAVAIHPVAAYQILFFAAATYRSVRPSEENVPEEPLDRIADLYHLNWCHPIHVPVRLAEGTSGLHLRLHTEGPVGEPVDRCCGDLAISGAAVVSAAAERTLCAHSLDLCASHLTM